MDIEINITGDEQIEISESLKFNDASLLQIDELWIDDISAEFLQRLKLEIDRHLRTIEGI